MLIHGILNPHIQSLLGRVRHTNTLLIADRGFPFWPQVETIDITLVDDIPRVLDVLAAIRTNFKIGAACMASEFEAANPTETRQQFAGALAGIPLTFEPHSQFRQRIPSAIGIIRTADTIQYANILLESA